jgi:hypothetical protein
MAAIHETSSWAPVGNLSNTIGRWRESCVAKVSMTWPLMRWIGE